MAISDRARSFSDIIIPSVVDDLLGIFGFETLSPIDLTEGSDRKPFYIGIADNSIEGIIRSYKVETNVGMINGSMQLFGRNGDFSFLVCDLRVEANHFTIPLATGAYNIVEVDDPSRYIVTISFLVAQEMEDEQLAELYDKIRSGDESINSVVLETKYSDNHVPRLNFELTIAVAHFYDRLVII